MKDKVSNVQIVGRAKLKAGDRVVNRVSGVTGTVEYFYFPTACGEHTMIRTEDGRQYHGPTTSFAKF